VILIKAGIILRFPTPISPWHPSGSAPQIRCAEPEKYRVSIRV